MICFASLTRTHRSPNRGRPTSGHIGLQNPRRSSIFHDFLVQSGLHIPATFPESCLSLNAHEKVTYFSKDQSHDPVRIDYVACTQGFEPLESSCEVWQCFESALLVPDHVPTSCCFVFHGIVGDRHWKRRVPTYDRSSLEKRM